MRSLLESKCRPFCRCWRELARIADAVVRFVHLHRAIFVTLVQAACNAPARAETVVRETGSSATASRVQLCSFGDRSFNWAH